MSKIFGEAVTAGCQARALRVRDGDADADADARHGARKLGRPNPWQANRLDHPGQTSTRPPSVALTNLTP